MPGFDDEDDDRPRRRRPASRDPDEDDYDDAGGRGRAYMQPHRGGLILVFGILGVTVCGIFGIMAHVMGKGDLREIDAGRMDPEGRPLTQVGYILGLITTILLVVTLAIGTVAVVAMIVFG